MSTVDIALELADLPHVPVTALEPFQGNLKELSDREYHKLKKSLEENGVIVPFFVWQETGKLLDGHQRQRVFMREGWHVDVPVVYISADDVQDAKRKLLVISSQYGKVTQDGWDEFTFDLDDDWLHDTVQFDALPFVFGEWGDDGEPAESQDDENDDDQPEHYLYYDGDNEYGIPDLLPGMELFDFAGLTAWGSVARDVLQTKWHFYVDDYRFQRQWMEPDKLIEIKATGAVEVNYSTYDNQRKLYALNGIFRKRWLARHWQEHGIKTAVDLCVTPKYRNLALLGVPVGWRSYVTRAYSDELHRIREEFDLACEHARSKDITFLVYAGGKHAQEICKNIGVLWLDDWGASFRGERQFSN